MRSIWSSVVGVVLGLSALGFVGLRLRDDFDASSADLSTASWIWLVVAVVAAAAAMLTIAISWRSVLREFGVERSPGDVVARYFVGEIGKYLPGGVWPIIGRAELIVRAGAHRSAAYGSVAMSLGCLYLAAALIVSAGMALQVNVGARWVVLVAACGVVVLHPRPFGWCMSMFRRVTGSAIDDFSPSPSWGRSVGLVVRYTPAWLLVALSTTAVAFAVGGRDDPVRVMAAAVLSWIVGFVVAPVPGGVGVREAAFVAACGLAPGTAAATALLARSVFVAVDAGGAAIAGAWLGRRSSSGSAISRPIEQ